MSNSTKLIRFLLAAATVIFVGVTVYSATVIVPQTGQTICYDSTGATVTCAGTGQDGDKLIGEAWPSPRFTAGTNTVTDNLTGLEWFKNGSTPTIGSCTGGKLNWINALTYVACLNSAGAYGYSDWRLPNVNELRSLMPSEQGGGAAWLMTQGWSSIGNSSGMSLWYWASSTYASTESKAWAVNFRAQNVAEGLMGAAERMKSSQTLYVLPVRGGTL